MHRDSRFYHSQVVSNSGYIFDSGELDKNATVRAFRTVRQEGSGSVARTLEFFNLDVIISFGYIIWTLPDALLTSINKREESVLSEELCVQEDTVLHIRSNVMDMLKFSGNGIRKYLSTAYMSVNNG